MVSFLAVLVPPYIIELVTESLYFSPYTPYYFFFSSFRLYFFVVYLGLVSFSLGKASKRLRLTWLSFAMGLLGLFALLFLFGCSPKVCYNSGTDGLEPLREYSFFLTEGLALSAVGFSVKNGLSKVEAMAGNFSAFYAIAYYPVTFAIAGVGFVAQFSPLPLLVLVSLLSFATSVRVSEKWKDQGLGFVVTTSAFLVLTGVSVGIASQYLMQVIPLISILLACVVTASLLGALQITGGREGVRRVAKSQAFAAGLVGFVLLLMVLIPMDAVSGTSPNPGTGSYSFQTPVVVAGYNSGPNLGSRGVAANFSFGGTDSSSIQPDNYLAAGVGIHSPNCCVDGIDYGYRADVFLYHSGSEVFVASGWEACDIITACGGHTWRHLMYFHSVIINSSVESNFRLSMEWENHTLSWFYSSGSAARLMASFQAPRQDNPGFDAGWLSNAPLPGGYPFFQFGIMSAFPIGHPGWMVTVSCPSLIMNLTWKCINHAGLVQGGDSYWKFIWRWGEDYPNVGATVGPATKTIIFHYSQVPIQDFETAW